MLLPGLEITASVSEATEPARPEGALTVSVVLSQGSVEERIHFRLTGVPPTSSPLAGEALLPLALVPAMRLGSPLRISQPIDRALLEGARQFQEIFSTWYPEFKKVPILAESVERSSNPGGPAGVGVFLSGGLDSSYTLLKHRGEVTHALFIHGCDIPLDNTDYRDRTVLKLAETAAECGAQLIVIETDLLRFSNPLCHWGHHYHGSALAAMAMLLGGSLRKVYIASSTSYLRIVPWGSSVVTDPLWSSSRLQVVHDGAEAERIEKARKLMESPVALRNLRVCFEAPVDGYNCGRCEKCFRTRVALRILGVPDEATTFDHPLDLDAMVAHPEAQEKFGRLRSWMLNRETARRLGNDPELIAALDELHRRSSFLGLVHALSRDKDAIVASPQWRTSLPKFRSALFNSLRNEDTAWFADKVMRWLPAARELAFTRLAHRDWPWFRRRFFRHALRHLLPQRRLDEKAPSQKPPTVAGPGGPDDGAH